MSKRCDLIIGLLLLVFCGVVFYETFGLTSHFLLPISPSFFPRVWIALLGLFSLLLIVSNLRRGKSSVGNAPAEPVEESRVAEFIKQRIKHYRLVIYSLATFLAYILSLSVLGFLFSTMLFLALLQWILGPRQIRQLPFLLVISIVSAYAVHWIFQGYLHVFLPEGILFQ